MSLPLKRRSTDVPFGPRPLEPNRRLWLNAPRLSQDEMKSVAAELRRRLKEDNAHGWPPPPPPPPPPVDKKLLADARLLLLLASGERLPPQRENASKAGKLRCGACALCLRGECGKCGNCLDKRKYGGRGARKQACSARQCLFPKPGHREVRALES
jgi:hypothetical protein